MNEEHIIRYLARNNFLIDSTTQIGDYTCSGNLGCYDCEVRLYCDTIKSSSSKIASNFIASFDAVQKVIEKYPEEFL